MTLFLVGLIGFFGLHAFSALRSRDPVRDVRKRLGEARYMGVYSLASLAFFALLLIGYGRAPDGPLLWAGPDLARTLTVPLNTLALILVAAAYIPVGHIKRTVHHPMMLGVLVWALSHLAIGADLKKALLMGGFALYAALSVIMAFRRGERVTALPRRVGDVIAIGVGIVAAGLMLVIGHGGYV